MAKIPLTIEISEAIRELRLQNKIASKEIAGVLGRSASYVSKIENGLIKTISDGELDLILQLVFPNSKSSQERLDKLVEFQIKKHGVDISEDKAWFYNLDTVYRLIPISTGLIAEINDLLAETKTSIEELVARINSNEDISEAERNDPSLPYNEWVESNDNTAKLIIRMKLRVDDVVDILDGTAKICNFVTMQAIVHYLFKIKLFPEKTELDIKDLVDVQHGWQEMLDRHKFFTLSRKEKLLSQTHSKNQAKSILTEFDIENEEAINLMLQFIKMTSNMDVYTTNKSLKQFNRNMDWDYNFMLRIIGFDYAAIGECSFSNKLQMLREIREIISKYKNMPEEQRLLDTYDDFD